MLDKCTLFDQISVALLDVGSNRVEVEWLFTGLFADRHVEGLDAEVAGHRDSTVDVIAKTLEKFGSLRFDNI